VGGWRNARPQRPARASAAGVAIFASVEAYQDDARIQRIDEPRSPKDPAIPDAGFQTNPIDSMPAKRVNIVNREGGVEAVASEPFVDESGARSFPRNVWTARHWAEPAARARDGQAARAGAPRGGHAAFAPTPGRDPIAILAAQEADRLPELVPLRHRRMAESPFAYFRGTPAVMAHDLANTPRTGFTVQASGDAHVGNFGLFASPERSLVFDANDFDETLPGPWEWDVKRLATSVVIAGQANGFTAQENRSAAMATVRAYRTRMVSFAGMRLIDVWYSVITDHDIRVAIEHTDWYQGSTARRRRAALEAIFSKARRRDGLRAFHSLTRLVDGHRVIVEDPPMVVRVDVDSVAVQLEQIFVDYRSTLPESRRELLERYRFVDFARKVVGVGSIGTRCFVLVLEGRDGTDPLILQAKEATASVLEPYLPASRHESNGQRVVAGQQLMQTTPDMFLGWTRGPQGRDFYLRQLWDMKGSVDLSLLEAPRLGYYGGLCGWALARAHARSGDPVAIAAYLGKSDRFDGAVADFAETYADQNHADHARYVEAVEAGRVDIGL